MRKFDTVADGIHRVADSFVNWYLVEDHDGLTVVDAGLPTSWNLLLAAVAELGRRMSEVKAVLLTHAHFDHVGFAERARARLGIPVWVHEADARLARHPLSYQNERSPLRYLWRPSTMRILGSMTAHGAMLTPGVKEPNTFTPDNPPVVPGNPQIILTPGHTNGHCAYFFPERDTLIAGDALVTLDPYTGREGPRLVARAATANAAQAAQSLDRLAETRARIVCTGHGEVWTAGIEQAVALAKNEPHA